IISQNKTEIKIFVLGFARPLMDSVYTTLKLAGLNTQTVEHKAMALTRAAGHTDALIVDCEPDAFEILIINSGIPVTIHRISPKNEMSTLSDNLNQLVTELNRAIDFHNLTNPESPLTQNTPVLLSGSLCDDISSRDLIITSLGHKIEFFEPRTPVAADFPVSSFAANLGLLYKKSLSTGCRLKPFEKQSGEEINLLTARKRALKKPLNVRQLLVTAAITGAIVLFIPAWFLRLQAENESTALKSKADNLSLELASVNRKLVENSQIQNKIDDLLVRTDGLKNERMILGGKGDIAANLLAFKQQLPAGANITGISSKAENITLEGTARNREDVIRYIYNLEKQTLFSEVRIALIDINPAGENEVIFRLTAER
ncbi:MAG TPA: PilN domain-containing protein, partial [Dehalococcoidales bacterium]|nr:PilN domain-containing protein [Dehalococcoidales bacterium]